MHKNSTLAEDLQPAPGFVIPYLPDDAEHRQIVADYASHRAHSVLEEMKRFWASRELEKRAVAVRFFADVQRYMTEQLYFDSDFLAWEEIAQ